MVVKINDVIIDNVNDDIFYRKELTEAIEYATINLSHQPKLDLNYFDEVVIDGVDWYLVDYKWTIAEFDTPLYNYEIQIANPAIRLKGIILPNRTLTKRLFGEELTVVEALEQYLQIYAPDLVLSQIFGIFGDEPIREYQWSNPSLFDVINTFLREKEAVVTMSNFNTISIRTLKGSSHWNPGIIDPINMDNVTNIEGSTDFENYATNIRTTISRGITESYITEELKFVTPGDVIFNNDRFTLFTTYNIERIIQIEYACYGCGGGKMNFTGGDAIVNNHLVEKSVYDTLKVGLTSDVSTERSNYVYFTPGTNEIGGWDYTEDAWLLLEELTFSNIIKAITPYLDADPEKFIFRVTYVPRIDNVLFETKTQLHDKKTINASQGEAVADAALLSKRQLRLAQRAGQEMITIYGVNTPPKLLDYYKEYNVYAVETMANTTQYDWIAYAQKDYANVILSSAIWHEFRTTEIIDMSRALITNHITHFNYTFTTTPHTFDTGSMYEGIEHQNFFKTTFDRYISGGFGDTKNIVFLIMTTNDDPPSDDILEVDYKYFFVPSIMMRAGNSIVTHFRFEDNFSVGTKLYDEDVKVGVVSYSTMRKQDRARYTFSNNELTYISITAAAQASPRVTAINTIDQSEDKDAFKALLHAPEVTFDYLLPVLGNVIISRDVWMPRFKDNREVLAETMQMNLINSDENVIIYDDVFDLLPLGDPKTNEKIRVYYNLNENRKFTKSNPFTTNTSGAVGYSSSFNSEPPYEYKITVGWESSDIYGWIMYLGDKPLIAVNGKNIRTIYGKEL